MTKRAEKSPGTTASRPGARATFTEFSDWRASVERSRAVTIAGLTTMAADVAAVSGRADIPGDLGPHLRRISKSLLDVIQHLENLHAALDAAVGIIAVASVEAASSGEVN